MALEDSTPFIIFISLAVIVIFYFLFFQQYLTGLIVRFLLWIFTPKTKSIKVQRIAYSILSGRFTAHHITIITEDLSIYIVRISGGLFYWRKIYDYISTEQSPKKRLHISIDGLRITMYNRKYITDRVDKNIEFFQNGGTTKDWTDYIQSQYPLPEAHELNIIFRFILPLSFKIRNFSITFGNPLLPAFVVAQSTLVDGSYSVLARASEEAHMKTEICLKMENFTFTTHSNVTPLVYIKPNSMRDISNRSRGMQDVIRSDLLDIKVSYDMIGCYVNPETKEAVALVRTEPQYEVFITFAPKTELSYGPYTDKLRGAFMTFYKPFCYHHPIIREAPFFVNKFMNVHMKFDTESVFNIPFVSNQNQNECLKIYFDGSTKFDVDVPQNVATIEENVIKTDFIFEKVKILARDDIEIISAQDMHVVVEMVYREKWSDSMDFVVNVHFTDCSMTVHPYHIDFLTQLGTDWVSYYPFIQTKYTPNNFSPARYIVNLEMEPGTITLFSEKKPPYEVVFAQDSTPQTVLTSPRLLIGIQLNTDLYDKFWKEANIQVKGQPVFAFFKYPKNHPRSLRRRSSRDNFVVINAFSLTAGYKWTGNPEGDINVPINIKLAGLGGIATYHDVSTVFTLLSNYTGQKMYPLELQPLLQPSTSKNRWHTSVKLRIIQASINYLLDLYSMKRIVLFGFSQLFVSMDSLRPYSHIKVDIEDILVEYPALDNTTDLMIDATEDQLRVSIAHIIASLQSIYTEKYTTYHNMGVDLGAIIGYTSISNIKTILTILQNLLYDFGGEDETPQTPIDPFQELMLKHMRVNIESIDVVVIPNEHFALVARVPSSITVHTDTLKSNQGSNRMYVLIPVIDAALIPVSQAIATPDSRVTLFIEVERNFAADNSKDDNLFQKIVLSHYDNESLLYFIHDPKTLGKSPRVPQIYFPEVYKPNLKDQFYLFNYMLPNVFSNGQKTISFISPHADGDDRFVKPETMILWSHQFYIARIMNHDFTFKEEDPQAFFDRIQLRDFVSKNYKIEVTIPHELSASLSLSFVALLMRAFTYLSPQSKASVLDSVIRSNMSKASNDIYYKTYSTWLFIPSVRIELHDELFSALLGVDEIKLLSGSTLDFSIKNIKLNSNTFDIKVKDVKVFKDAEMLVKVAPPSIQLTDGFPLFLSSLLTRFSKLLKKTGVKNYKNKYAEFKAKIEHCKLFEEEKERLAESHYKYNNPILPNETNSLGSAYYTTSYKMGHDPELIQATPPEIESSTIRLLLPEVSLKYGKETEIIISIAPVVIQQETGRTGIFFEINSFKAHIHPEIFNLVQPYKLPTSKARPKNPLLEYKTGIFIHFSLKDLEAQFLKINLNLKSLCVSMVRDTTDSLLPMFLNITSFKVTAEDLLYVCLEGVTFSRKPHSFTGTLHVSPIQIEFSLALITNPGVLLDGAKLPSLPQSEKPKEPEKESKPLEIQELSIAFVVQMIAIRIKISDKTNLLFALPSLSGLTFQKDQIHQFFAMIQAPIIDAGDKLKTQLTAIILRGCLDPNRLNLSLILDELVYEPVEQEFQMIFVLINELLSTDFKSISKSEQPQPQPPKETSSKMALCVHLHIQKVRIAFNEIKSGLEVKNIDVGVFDKQIQAKIDSFSVLVDDSDFEMRLKLVKTDETVDFLISRLAVALSSTFLSKVMNIKDVLKRLLENYNAQDKLKGVVNEGIKQVVDTYEKEKNLILNQKTEVSEFPTQKGLQIGFRIKDIQIKVSLPPTQDLHSGDFITEFDLISLLIQRRKSQDHTEQSTGAAFAVHNMRLKFDSSESTSTGFSSEVGDGTSIVESASALSVQYINVNALLFQQSITALASVNSLEIQLYPTIVSAMKRISSFFQSTPPKEKKSEPEEGKKKPSLSVNAQASFLNTMIILKPYDNHIPIPQLFAKIGLTPTRINASFEISGTSKDNSYELALMPSLLRWVKQIKARFPRQETPKPQNIQLQIPTETKTAINIIVRSSPLKVVLNTGQANSVSVNLSIGGLAVFASTVSSSANLKLSNLVIQTDNAATRGLRFSRTDRLFRMQIPSVDIFASPDSIIGCISTIEIQASPDKIGDVQTFLGVWTFEVPDEIPKAKAVKTEKKPMKLSFLVKEIDVTYHYGANRLKLVIKPLTAGQTLTSKSIAIREFRLDSLSGDQQSSKSPSRVYIPRISVVMVEKDLLVSVEEISFKLLSLKDPVLDMVLSRLSLFVRSLDKSYIVAFVDGFKLKIGPNTINHLMKLFEGVVSPILKLLEDNTPKDKENKPKKKRVLVKRKPKLIGLVSGIQLAVFKHLLNQNENVFIKLGSTTLNFNPERRNKRFDRKLAMSVNGLGLYFNETYENTEKGNVLIIPSLDIDLQTLQEILKTDPPEFQVTYNFITNFAAPIEPTTHIQAYNSVFEILSHILPKTQTEDISARKGKEKTEPDPVYTFVQENLVLAPQIQVMNAKIDLDNLLKFLRISMVKVIPEQLYMKVSIPLNQLAELFASKPEEDDETNE